MASCSSIKLFSLPAAGVLHNDNTGYEGDRFPRILWSRQFGQKSGSVCSREMAGTAILGRLASMAQPSQGGCIGTRRFTCPARMVRQAHHEREGKPPLPLTQNLSKGVSGGTRAIARTHGSTSSPQAWGRVARSPRAQSKGVSGPEAPSVHELPITTVIPSVVEESRTYRRPMCLTGSRIAPPDA